MRSFKVNQGDFGVSISRNKSTPAYLIPDTYAYFFCMKNGDTYSITVENRGATKCDAKITIDGEVIGVWRVWSRNTNTIHCPLDIDRCLVFKKGSEFNCKETSDGSYPTSGKISIEFFPELGSSADVAVPYSVQYPVNLGGSNGNAYDIDCSKYGTGTTILGDTFQTEKSRVALITNVDESRKQTIDVYLVEEY